MKKILPFICSDVHRARHAVLFWSIRPHQVLSEAWRRLPFILRNVEAVLWLPFILCNSGSNSDWNVSQSSARTRPDLRLRPSFSFLFY